MIDRPENLPAVKPHPVALSLLVAILIAVAEVAGQIAASLEPFPANQCALALSTNIALMGALAIFAAVLLSLALRAVGQDRSKVGSMLVCMTVAAADIFVVDWTVILGKSRHAITAACIAAAILLPLSLAVIAARRVIRAAAMILWLTCSTSITFTTLQTHRLLSQWTHPVAASKTPSDLPNIILIVIDTLRWDRVGFNGGKNLTPNLDRLAASSIIYPNAINTAPWTLPTHASLFTGLYPHQHNVSWGSYKLDDRHPVLAEILRDRGYQTFGVSNNWLLGKDNGFARGFDGFVEVPNQPRVTIWRLATRMTLPQRLLQWMGLPKAVGVDAGSAFTNWLIERQLTASKTPFFLFVNYFEPHDPYFPPPQFVESHLTPAQRQAYRRFPQRQEDLCAHACGLAATFTKEQIELMAAAYDAEVAYQDEIVGHLIAALEDKGVLDRSWLILTSDHGELFGESGMVFHTAGAHYQLLRVPLLIRPPGGVAPRVIQEPVQPVDVFHRMLMIADAPLPAAVNRSFPLPLEPPPSPTRSICVAQTFGASITGLYVSQYRHMQQDITAHLTWLTSVYARGLLLEIRENSPPRLFEVSRDPDMTEDLAGKRPEVVRQLLDAYRQWLQTDSGGGA